MNDLLTLRGLEKRFRDRLLFRIDTLTLSRAQTYLLTGGNGAGKSTLLRILGGLEPAAVEQAFFLGRQVQFHPYSDEMRRAVVYVHQHPVLFDTSIDANIGYGLAARGMARDAVLRRVEEAVRWAGLESVRMLPVASLSGGEKQRVALARAKVLEPTLLLLDEPTASLDEAAREQVMQLLPQLTGAGTSVVIACHDRELLGLADAQRMDLREGKLWLDGGGGKCDSAGTREPRSAGQVQDPRLPAGIAKRSV